MLIHTNDIENFKKVGLLRPLQDWITNQQILGKTTTSRYRIEYIESNSRISLIFSPYSYT